MVGVDDDDNGIIPAYAGNTPLPKAETVDLTDHPRVCGEHDGAEACALFDEGSSPRMRGTLQFHGRMA